MHEKDLWALGETVLTQLGIWLAKAVRWYKILFWGTLAVAVVAVIVGVGANVAGMKGFSNILAAVFMAVWAFHFLHPTGLLVVFGLGMPAGLPNFHLREILTNLEIPDFRIKEIFGEGYSLVEKYGRAATHVLLVAALTLLVIGAWDIERPKFILPMLEVLILLGAWTALFVTKAIWYRWATLVLLLAILVQATWNGYAYVYPQDEAEAEIAQAEKDRENEERAKEGKRIAKKIRAGEPLTAAEEQFRRGLKETKAEEHGFRGIMKAVYYRKLVDVDLKHFGKFRECGISAGRRTFETPYELKMVDKAGATHPIHSWMRVEGKPAGEVFEVHNEKDGKGCVEVTIGWQQPPDMIVDVYPRTIRILIKEAWL